MYSIRYWLIDAQSKGISTKTSAAQLATSVCFISSIYEIPLINDATIIGVCIVSTVENLLNFICIE